LTQNTLWFDQVSINDVDKVGGKNASLGEMISNLSALQVLVPNGFATTAEAYVKFLSYQDLAGKINQRLSGLDIEDVSALSAAGAEIRQWIMDAPFPDDLADDVRKNFLELQQGDLSLAVAVRSSATAEDLPDASFAGQQETHLNIIGIDAVFDAMKDVFASLFNDRAIAYRDHHGFDHNKVALSVGIQRMVRSETASSGVMFTMDTESGFEDVVFITSSYGLGESIVQGAVNPDEFYVHKATLTDGRPAILRRNLGAKALKMIYGYEGVAGKSVVTKRVDREERR